MLNYEKYMKICLNLAKKGEGKTSPNPMVGAILVDKKGNIVAKGYHHYYGGDHAEVDCIKKFEQKNKKPDYSELTMFVSLEPCNHYGKTPPCSDLIIKKGIKKIVIAVSDPNKKHSGGIKKLKSNKIDVVEDVLSEDAKKLNEIFFYNVKEEKTFFAIKTATTLDGKIATKTGASKWITSEKSRKHVQKLRNKYDGILSSAKTVILDNPSLTARGKNYKNPIRIILDKDLKTDIKARVYNDDGTKVLLFHSAKNNKKYPDNVEMLKVGLKNNHLDLTEIAYILYKKRITSVLIEAGGVLNGAFLKEKLVNKIYHFIAPKILGDKNAKTFIEGFDIKEIIDSKVCKLSKLKHFSPDIMLEIEL